MTCVLIFITSTAWGFTQSPMLVTQTRQQCEAAREEVLRINNHLSPKGLICLAGNAPVTSR